MHPKGVRIDCCCAKRWLFSAKKLRFIQLWKEEEEECKRTEQEPEFYKAIGTKKANNWQFENSGFQQIETFSKT